jgi:hypothetical protein
LRHGAARVDIVEPDRSVTGLIEHELAGFAGPILSRPGVRLHVGSARQFTAASRATFSLIVLPPYPSGGRSTLAEGFATTVEAFTGYLRRLEPGGLLALQHPLRLPPRDSLKLVATALDALGRLGVAEPARHLLLVRSWDSVLLLVRRTPFPERELAAVDAFAEALAFDLGWHPGMTRAMADRFNLLGEPVLFDGVAALIGPDSAAFVDGYAFDIRPATDDRPYFHDFFRWRALPALWAAARQGNAGLLDWGWPLQLITFGVATLSGLALILLPARLLTARSDRRPRRATAAYFLLVGLGFLLIEIAVMQRLILLLGGPVHAFSLTLATFLIGAGLESGVAAWAERAPSGAPGRWLGRLDLATVLVAGLALLHALAAPSLLELGLEWAALPRAMLAVATMAPLAIAMGLPFPLALARLRAAATDLVPWCWGVNGCASVIAAALAGLLTMSLGSRGVIILGAVAYAIAALAQQGIPGPMPDAGPSSPQPVPRSSRSELREQGAPRHDCG